jgi:hypothetical protein
MKTYRLDVISLLSCPDPMAEWPSHLPLEQKTWVPIPQIYEDVLFIYLYALFVGFIYVSKIYIIIGVLIEH